MTLAMTTPPACYATVDAYYVTHRERGPFHTDLVVDGRYAMAAWHGTHSGGEGAFERRSGRWCVLTNGGGALNVDELVRFGVPRPNAERLSAKLERVFAAREQRAR
ncbi:MAG: hypothetical protein JWN27_4500 [Candidatus Eremiobacteraeota bacterium]|nr:hypothetical protein [Candidatus Eremiobacteraeota bacterium]